MTSTPATEIRSTSLPASPGTEAPGTEAPGRPARSVSVEGGQHGPDGARSPWRLRADVAGRLVPVWASALALAMGGFAIGTTEFASMGVLPDITDTFGVTIPQGGWGITAYALGVVIGAPLIAVLTVRIPRKALLTGLVAALGLGNMFTVLAPTFGAFLASRFLSGLPHGAYFGIGAVVVSSLVPPHLRGRSVAFMMTGLTIANVAGVPLSTLLGQQVGWRATYLVTVVVFALTALAISVLVPRIPLDGSLSPRRELAALRRPQVWLTLAMGSIGWGGLFAIYSYISPTLTEASGLSESAVPLVLAVFGIGLTLGTVAGGRLADWSVDRTLAIGLVALIFVGVLFAALVGNPVTAVIMVFVVAFTPSCMMSSLTLRLMDAATEGKSLAASLNHSALNIANALGAWLGGVVIAAGFGYRAPALVGSVLAAAGLFVLTVAVAVGRRADRG